MAPATSAPAPADVTDSSSSRSSSDSPTPTFTTVVEVTPSPSIVTTTLTQGDSGSLPTVGATVMQTHGSGIPIPAIAGGTAAGVVCALVMVVGWTWWGKCIKRKKAKERKEALAFLEVRENTRKNASSLSHSSNQHKPAFTARRDRSRKVKFASNGTASSQSTLRGSSELKRAIEKSAPPPVPPLPPRPPTPMERAKDVAKGQEVELPPPIPRKNPRRDRGPVSSFAPSEAHSGQHRLMHQASTLSSGSEYSTQSAIEERQTGVPSSLLLALTSDGNRRSLLANYLPWSRNRTSTVSHNRLSEYSTGSVYSQFDDQPWESVGFAYGGED